MLHGSESIQVPQHFLSAAHAGTPYAQLYNAIVVVPKVQTVYPELSLKPNPKLSLNPQAWRMGKAD